uniref:Recep_L_domain domain-containing protein n=1 Tax=Gongylonema pulchrum TaxID=637853 RepID=A0A183EEC3_9BILA
LKIPTLDVIDIIGYSYCVDLDRAEINRKRLKLASKTQQFANRLLINATGLLDISHQNPVVLTWPQNKNCTVLSGVTGRIL